MSELKVGDSFPSGVTFSYVPYTPENGDITSCGMPVNFDASKGMFTHLPLPLVISLLYRPNWLSVSLYTPLPFPYHPIMHISPALRSHYHRIRWQESRPILRPRCIHSRLLGKASPRLHREPLQVEGQGRGYRSRDCI